MSGTRLGELMVKESLITPAQLSQALEQQKKNGGRLGSSLNLNELAGTVNLSPYHFARTFKKLTGLSPMHYFIQMRLQQACNLLDTTRQPIKQIAYDVGYPDPLYFSRIFRRIIGMTPRTYRRWTSYLTR